jgi:hypothetical protein
MNTTDDKNAAAREQAKAQLASIIAYVAALECDYERLEELKEELADLQNEANDAETDSERTAALQALADWQTDNQDELDELTEAAGDCENQDEARTRIEEDALSVEVRGDWHSPGESDGSKATEFKILLCTGGPACQIIGELDDYGQPDSARLQFQDWFTSWEDLILTSDERAAVLTYCQVFYFEEY